MLVIDLINKKRANLELTSEEINWLVDKYLKNDIKDYQMSAFLMAVCINSMSDAETFALTEAMLKSGKQLDFKGLDFPIVDKHSTGGVGDKTTLIVAPIVASLGVGVAKMSGRSLGHTGGTIDKLESIKGFNVNITKASFLKQLKEIGIVVASQTSELVPADKKIYALRDVSGTTASIPLIASSIMSKKIASGADKIVLDVKYGKGALISDLNEAIILAKTMTKIGNYFGKETIALVTNMDVPLGIAVGNGLEILEAMEVLKGKGEPNLTKLCLTLATYMVSLGLNISLEEASLKVKENFYNKKALKKFQEWIKYQGGNLKKITVAKTNYRLKAPISGYLNSIDALKIAKYVKYLGGGRLDKKDTIDYGVGIILNQTVGNYVNEGETLAFVYKNGSKPQINAIIDAFIIEDELRVGPPLIHGVVR